MPTDLRTLSSATLATTRPRLLTATLFAIFAVASSGIATAQRPSDGQYRPARPTLSPYMGLLQTNTGPIPNYFSLVRPMMQQQSFNRQLSQATRAQSIQIQSLSTQGSQAQPTSQTGNASGFQQYLHYYPPMRGARRR